MQNISKSEVSHWLLLDLMAQKTTCSEKNRLFSNKYNCDFVTFENKIENAEKENFGTWDDLI